MLCGWKCRFPDGVPLRDLVVMRGVGLQGVTIADTGSGDSGSHCSISLNPWKTDPSLLLLTWTD